MPVPLIVFLLICVAFYVFVIFDKTKETSPNSVPINVVGSNEAYKKELKIDFKVITYCIWSVVISVIVVFIIEHFGTFNYLVSETSNQTMAFEHQVSGDTPLVYIDFITPFGSEVRLFNPSINLYQMNYEFDYPKKFYFYKTALLKDYPYIIAFAFGITLIFLFFKKYTLKFK